MLNALQDVTGESQEEFVFAVRRNLDGEDLAREPGSPKGLPVGRRQPQVLPDGSSSRSSREAGEAPRALAHDGWRGDRIASPQAWPARRECATR